jgi:hypothetical protein
MTATAADEVRDRLLKAWRGEIVAGGVYDLIARRMPDREGEIAGLEMTLAGVIVGGATYLVGLALPT